MDVTDKDVKHIAALARLELTSQEKDLYRTQLEKIFQWMGKLGEIDTSGVEPTAHVLGMENVTREDIPVSFENRQALLSNAPEKERDLFKVKKVIEQG